MVDVIKIDITIIVLRTKMYNAPSAPPAEQWMVDWYRTYTDWKKHRDSKWGTSPNSLTSKEELKAWKVWVIGK